MGKGKKNPRQFRNSKSIIGPARVLVTTSVPSLQPGNCIEVKGLGKMLVDSIGGGNVTLLGRGEGQIYQVDYPFGSLRPRDDVYFSSESPSFRVVPRTDVRYGKHNRKLRSSKL